MASKKTAKSPAAGASLPLGADPLPAQAAPSPPVGFSAPAKGQRRPGKLPTAQQVRDAADVAQELTSNATYAADFGARVPPAASLGAALRLAKGWSDQLASAELWQAYARVQYESAWRAALDAMHAFAPEFKLADKHDPAIAKRYPQTRDFLDVRSAVSKRGAQTRAAKKKAAAKKSA